MRDIKFRGMRSDSKWVFGYYYAVNGYSYIHRAGEIDEKGFSPMLRTKVNTKTIGQFTGMQDKNGVDIYEGDIVLKNTTELCDPDNKCGGVKWVYKPFLVEYKGRSFCPSFLFEGEVVGNIHENPELLDDKS